MDEPAANNVIFISSMDGLFFSSSVIAGEIKRPWYICKLCADRVIQSAFVSALPLAGDSMRNPTSTFGRG